MKTVNMKVASFFVRHVPDFGIVVGNEGEDVNVPEHLAEEWAQEGLVGKPVKGKPAKDPLDHDGDGFPGGSLTGDESTVRRGIASKATGPDSGADAAASPP